MITNKKKQGKPFIGLLLFVISIVLFFITVPLGVLYGFLYTLVKKGLKGIGFFALEMAISIDQLGNVSMQHLLNLLWITKGGYQFGNRDETISSVLGKNQQNNSLSKFGKVMVFLLDKIDKDHALNSIDYHIEPKN